MKSRFFTVTIAALLLTWISTCNSQAIPINPGPPGPSFGWHIQSTYYQVSDEFSNTAVSIDTSGIINLQGADSTRAIKMLMAYIFKQSKLMDSLQSEMYWYEKRATFIKYQAKN